MSSKAKIYLYREGNECSAITGGWEQGSKSIGTFSKSSNSFDFNVNYVKAVKSWNVAQSINLIDFSKFDRVLYDVFLSSSYEGFKSSFYIAGCNPKLDTYDDVANSKWRVTTSDIGTINSFLEFECNSSAYITIGFTIWENQSSNLTANFKNIYLETKENVISINSQNTSSINFSCNNLDNLITIKMDVKK